MPESDQLKHMRELISAKAALLAESGAIAEEMEALAKEATGNPGKTGIAPKMIILADRMRRVHDAIKALDLGSLGHA